MDTVIWVPRARGGVVILKSPPNKAARSRIPSKPIEPGLVCSASEIPRPLSFTWRKILPSASFKFTATRVAPAWRMILKEADGKIFLQEIGRAHV